MADLTTLIRLHKHELDEKRRVLSDLYTGMAQLEHQRRELERAFEREKKAAGDAGNIHFTFPQYVEKTNRERKVLDDQEAALEKKIAAAKDSMMETFSELKKYEMTQEERDRIAEEERQFKESREMDAVGLEVFRRKGEE